MVAQRVLYRRLAVHRPRQPRKGSYTEWQKLTVQIRFNPTLTEFIEPDQLEVYCGGTYNFEYKHDVYWPELNE